MSLDFLPSALDLARFQFAFTIVWHFLFPAFTIGLASYLAVLEARWLWTGNDLYLDIFRYWLRIFAIAFAMGVVSGIVMSYQFGTNWSVFADRTSGVIGPLLGYEVLTAFFLEAGFLGVMLFGLNRVGKHLHFVATCLVAGGTLLSAFWILAANSWMHTPTGHTLGADGRFMPESFFEIIFNPSFPYRFAHSVTAAYLTTAFIVGAVGAYHLLRDATNPRARVMFSMAMWMAAIVAPLQLVIGDLHGVNTFEHQPAKVAAMEGHFETERHAASILFGLPDARAGETRAQIAIPGLASLYLTHDWNGEVKGLKEFPRENWPTNIPLVFWSFRVMVGIGLLMIALGAGLTAAALARPVIRHAMVVAMGDCDGPVRVDRSHRGLDCHRMRTAAVYRLRTAAHRRQRVADWPAGCCSLAGCFYRGVLGRVRRRHLVFVSALRPDTATAATGRSPGPAGAHRRHCASTGTCRQPAS